MKVGKKIKVFSVKRGKCAKTLSKVFLDDLERLAVQQYAKSGAVSLSGYGITGPSSFTVWLETESNLSVEALLPIEGLNLGCLALMKDEKNWIPMRLMLEFKALGGNAPKK